jgi:hypothetical protein
MSVAILLASWPETELGINLGKMFIAAYERNFPDADIFVGINPAPRLDEWLSILEASPLNIRYAVTPKDLILSSDASGYQTALRLYRDTNSSHDLIWFNHFKGVSWRRIDVSETNISLLLDKRKNVEDVFADHPDVGLYALTGWAINHGKLDPGGPDDLTSQYYNFSYPTLRITPVHTFFVTRGEPVRNFVHNCNSSFFDKPLPNRFFFENDFCQCIFRQGYTAYIREPFPGVTKESIDTTIKNWKLVNGL